MKTNKPKANIFKIDDQGYGFLTVMFESKTLTIHSGDSTWDQALEAFRQEDWDALYVAMSPATYLTQYSFGHITYENGSLFYKGKPISHMLHERIRTNLSFNLSVSSLLAFLNNLYENPSKTSVDQLYAFLEQKHIPITEDGYFLAYKAVRKDYLDKYTGTISNHVGALVQEDRNTIDDNPNTHCGQGLHAGSTEYVEWYGQPSNGDRIVIVKINPRDVVSVPNDHNCQKLRVCEYLVIDDYTENLDKPVYNASERVIVESKVTNEIAPETIVETVPEVVAEVKAESDNSCDAQYDGSGKILSSWVTGWKYNSLTQTLVVESDKGNFAHSDVPHSVVERFVNAWRPGEYYNRYIRNRYASVDVKVCSSCTCSNSGDQQKVADHDFSGDSSWIESASYNYETGDLTVRMVNGNSYTYDYIDEDVWDDFVNADSPGEFYNYNIKQ